MGITEGEGGTMQYPYPAKDMASLVPRERWDQNAPVLPLTDGVLEMAEAENGDTLTRSPELCGDGGHLV